MNKMANPQPSPIAAMPPKRRQTHALDLLAQFSSVGSHPSATQIRRFSHVEIPSKTPTSALQRPSYPLIERKSSRVGTRLSKIRRAQDHVKKALKLERYRKDLSKAKRRKTKTILISDTMRPKRTKHGMVAKANTARNRVRQDIEMNTIKRRDQFLLEHQSYFKPLLPHSNYITKLSHTAGGNAPDTFTYEELDKQPAGLTATLKPYQLTGLSFLVYLYRNGMNGILGDEMGLGKTLQTIALMQFIENEHPVNHLEERRPYLVICPLSVLSSWISEVRKWAPKLKIIQLHGTAEERMSLKRVATGLDDRFGNEIAKSRKALKLDGEQIGEFDIIVTTYDIFLRQKSWFQTSFVWRYVILDEGHKIKNNKTIIAGALQTLKAEYRLILTGTPLQNNLTELWALLHWLYPDVFVDRTADLFRDAFDLSKGNVSTQVMDHARRLLEVIMLRRLKNSPGVNLGIPPKTEVLLYVPLTPMQKFWYMRLLTKAGDAILDDLFSDVKQEEEKALRVEILEQERLTKVELLLQARESHSEAAHQRSAFDYGWGESREIMETALELEKAEQEATSTKSTWTRLMNLIMQLRKCCTHPYQLPNAAPDGYLVGEHIVLASGKFIVLRKLLQHLVFEKRKKVLIFSGFLGVLKCVEDVLAFMGFRDGAEHNYLTLDGSTSRARRDLAIRLFNTTPNHNVILISTRAGGLGINLATATEVIFLDQDWNPQADIQAEARAHRIGQTQPVTVYKICTAGTVEEQMMGRIRKKLYLSAKITESMQSIHGRLTSKNTHGQVASDAMPQLSMSELKSLLRRGAQTLTRPQVDVNEMLSWDVETMLDKCRDQPVDFHNMDNASSRPDTDEEKWLSEMEKVKTAVYEGKHFQQQVTDKEIDAVLPPGITRADRREGKNTTVTVDGWEVSKESIDCGDWEAVPTLAGKDPRLAEPVREKKPEIEHESICHICWDGGELHCCVGCPRAYHAECLDEVDLAAMTRPFGATSCPQHVCTHCSRKAYMAGGMVFRCRFCENAFCEDCLDWDKTKLIGSNLPEFEMLGFAAVTQAYYISCQICTERCETDDQYRAFVENETTRIRIEYEEWLESRNIDGSQSAVFVTDPSDSSSTQEKAGNRVPGFDTSSSQTPTVFDSAARTPLYISIDSRQTGIKRGIEVDDLDEALLIPEKRKKSRALGSFGLDILSFFRDPT
ncbi:hypothetical protein EJ05DRAFT_228537 [Pseudovirgaria hyperparasitica]|uniref:ISWI chromatin-remodeling complex ATPase ISW2 n=1 Tax=Pseudovirgaria hyperparasitica TaxID=470096 RepID=A0A6A6VT75_9PEZI|nr:uncharacterized protein EJ05DRAFT_228537 [Pseudovirgaria hyperparasitica]KAF2752986.1 hypothetical protein EJ05DRAFT_228537 [Pseudovirgaria hyperparasitica]